jgi:Tfp pilus assembly protein PilN
MRPVNLLPASARGRKRGGGQGRSSYVALGVLGVLLVAVVMYVLTANQVTDRENDLVKVQQETAAAQAKAQANAAYGNFSQIKLTRLSAVSALAQQRFDWERMSREIAHVLPSGVLLTGLEASVAGGQQPSGPAEAASGAAAQPTVKLTGCAPAHPAVADTLVRLRRLHRAEEVTLAESARVGEDSGSAGGVSCDGKQRYGFTATVKFEAAEPQGSATRVPARLGGGA